MTDEEYIRAAVEYAKGWSAYIPGISGSANPEPQPLDEQAVLDALAAQLVRQIVRDTQYGPDRTMNTIKACVDFYKGGEDDG